LVNRAGTRRKNFGVTMTKGCKPKKGTDLSDVLTTLGDRLLQFCKAQAPSWNTNCTEIDSTPKFEQAYVQRYTGAHVMEVTAACTDNVTEYCMH